MATPPFDTEMFTAQLAVASRSQCTELKSTSGWPTSGIVVQADQQVGGPIERTVECHRFDVVGRRRHSTGSAADR
jgi:hypothetical protein